MLILPNQAGVALGLFAFAMAALISIFSGVTLEIAILRGGIAFLFFMVLGWLIAYLIYEEEKPEIIKKDVQKEKVEAPVETVENQKKTAASPERADDSTGDVDVHGLEVPDDSDF